MAIVSVQFGSLPFLVLNRVQRKKSGDHVYTTEDPLRPMPYPGRDPNALPYELYSALIGFLCTSGANLSPGNKHY